MSLDKAIKHKKEHRKEYRDSRRFDRTCRCHGSCPYCERNRTHSDAKNRSYAGADQVDEYFGYWFYPDPSDVGDGIDDWSMQ